MEFQTTEIFSSLFSGHTCYIWPKETMKIINIYNFKSTLIVKCLLKLWIFRRIKSPKFQINNTSSIQFWNQFIWRDEFYLQFLFIWRKDFSKQVSPYIGNKIGFILMLGHISLVGTVSWIKLLVKYTIAIQMLNKCIINSGRPMGCWRLGALHSEFPHLELLGELRPAARAPWCQPALSRSLEPGIKPDVVADDCDMESVMVGNDVKEAVRCCR